MFHKFDIHHRIISIMLTSTATQRITCVQNVAEAKCRIAYSMTSNTDGLWKCPRHNGQYSYPPPRPTHMCHRTIFVAHEERTHHATCSPLPLSVWHAPVKFFGWGQTRKYLPAICKWVVEQFYLAQNVNRTIFPFKLCAYARAIKFGT